MEKDIQNQQRYATPHTHEELLHIALTEQDENIAREAIGRLHLQGGRTVLEQARRLCASADTHERRVGADILGQLGVPTNTFHEEAIATLLGMLEREQIPEVLNAIAVALSHRHDPRAIEPLVRLKQHADVQVRYGVVLGLSCQENDLAIQTLIELSTDIDNAVRDWATFGLGSQIETDTPILRAALLARIDDEDADTSGEAMVGLARRHDRRMVEPLLAALEAGCCGRLLLEAAAEISEPRLYPVLLQLRDAWQDNKDYEFFHELEEAIEKCQPATSLR
jgi:HEAT repeat protein